MREEAREKERDKERRKERETCAHKRVKADWKQFKDNVNTQDKRREAD